MALHDFFDQLFQRAVGLGTVDDEAARMGTDQQIHFVPVVADLDKRVGPENHLHPAITALAIAFDHHSPYLSHFFLESLAIFENAKPVTRNYFPRARTNSSGNLFRHRGPSASMA